MFWWVLDSEFIKGFGWGGFNKDYSIATYHRDLGWSEHTLDDTYIVWLLAGVVH